MITDTYHDLEFQKLFHTLSYNASCPLGRSDCLSIKSSSESKIIVNKRDEYIVIFKNDFDSFQFSVVFSMREYISEVDVLLIIFLDNI